MAEVLRITGDRRLLFRLSSLEDKAERQMIAVALRAGAKPILERTEVLAPKRTRALVRSLKIKTQRRARFIRVRVQTEAGDYAGKTFYGAFQEFGWKTGRRTFRPRPGRRLKAPLPRRQVPGLHYMERAADQAADQAATAIGTSLKAQIEAEFGG